MPQFSYLTLFLLSIAVYFMWMDVALYINLQQVPPSYPDVKPIQANISDYNYSPFYPITVKLLLQGPTIHYIDTPLAYWTVAYTNVAQVLSANAVSIIGVFFAAAAARMFTSDSLRVRQFGVVMFKVRDYMDSLDGCVARTRRNQVALVVEPGTFGYMFDGICDAIGDIFVFIAITIYIYRNHYHVIAGVAKTVNGFSYKRLDIKTVEDGLKPKGDKKMLLGSDSGSGSHTSSSFVRRVLPCAFIVICIACQTLLSSAMWNSSLIQYHKLLETNEIAKTPAQVLEQNKILKSSTMWMIIYFWRLLNPHSVTQFILASILYNRMFDYISNIQYIGFIPIFSIGIISHAYCRYMTSTILAMG